MQKEKKEKGRETSKKSKLMKRHSQLSLSAIEAR